MEDAEETLRAIRQGEVDALLVSGPEGDRVFTLKGADHTLPPCWWRPSTRVPPTLAKDGKIIYANRRLAEMLKLPLEQVITATICDYIDPPDLELFEALFSQGKQGASNGEVRLRAADGSLVSAYLSLSSMKLEALPDMVCLAATDLTEQKRQQETVAAGRLFRANPGAGGTHAIIVCDAKGIITHASGRRIIYLPETLCCAGLKKSSPCVLRFKKMARPSPLKGPFSWPRCCRGNLPGRGGQFQVPERP